MLMERATGDVAVILAADNVLHDEHFLERLARPFADPAIAAAFPALVSTRADGATTRYFNAFSDPFNHFVYGGATSPVSYAPNVSREAAHRRLRRVRFRLRPDAR